MTTTPRPRAAMILSPLWLSLLVLSNAAIAAPPVALHWLGDQAPTLPEGVSLGVPWTRGAVPNGTTLVVHSADGREIPAQSWNLAYWPDGSLKWSGLAMAIDGGTTQPLTVSAGTSAAPISPVSVRMDGQSVEVSTGPLVCRVGRSGANLIESLRVDGREVGRDGHLVALREDRSEFDTKGVLREETFTSHINQVTIEQAGPVRAVLKIEGMHESRELHRQWLPFTVRLYFTAGLTSVRIVHTFIYDGDPAVDFIRGLGVEFAVPFREERQNRHIRFAGDDRGIWGEPVVMSPGYAPKGVPDAVQLNRDQLMGKRIPNLDAMGPKPKAIFETIAAWDGFKLNQTGPDSYSLDKRTGPASSWLHVVSGNRAKGLVFLGDVSGGLAIGVKRFWEKYPSALEISGASAKEGKLQAWFWSPEAPPMDLRHYDTIGHNGASYEDHQDGFSTPYGIANTSELTLWATPNTPDNASFAAMAEQSVNPPLLVCSPETYYNAHSLGVWSLPNRTTPDRAAIEDTLDRAWSFYHGEVNRRRWYGFWDYGDFIRTYDGIRHEWEYDIGGHAWNNTELMPNLWLWYTFLRTGNSDAFRLAEAMTRNTSEVDVYHQGRFAGLGSRHNVSHWGDGAKEARISEALLKRFYYYLTTDERTGDLMHEVINVDQTIARIQPLREELVRQDVPNIIRIGPDWEAMASNWMTEWERTGNPIYRGYLLGGMERIGGMPDSLRKWWASGYDIKTKLPYDIGEPNIKNGGFLTFFGGDQIMYELTTLIDCPSFVKAWVGVNDFWARQAGPPGYSTPRVTAYAALMENDPELGHKVWRELRHDLTASRHGDREGFTDHPLAIDDSSVPEPVLETVPNNTPGTSQMALNLITATELAKNYYVPPAQHQTK